MNKQDSHAHDISNKSLESKAPDAQSYELTNSAAQLQSIADTHVNNKFPSSTSDGVPSSDQLKSGIEHLSNSSIQELSTKRKDSSSTSSKDGIVQGKFNYRNKDYTKDNFATWNKNIHGVSKNSIIDLAKSETDFGDFKTPADFQAAIAQMNGDNAAAAAAAAAVPDVVVYPFPDTGAPKTLYRWCSTQAANAAVANGITIVGGIQDGIPTMPNLIKKSSAESGGGVGIVDASACLQIDTSKIPEIAGREENSIRKTPARNGTEYKILVDIPAAAIKKMVMNGKNEPKAPK